MDVYIVTQCVACGEAVREGSEHNCPANSHMRLTVTSTDELSMELPRDPHRTGLITISSTSEHRIWVTQADIGDLKCIEPGESADFVVQADYNPAGLGFPPVYTWICTEDGS